MTEVFHADLDEVIAETRHAWRPPPKLSLSQWADEHFYLSPESSAQAGRWRTLPYQREWMDAITDPRVTQVTVMKSARVGYTKVMNAAIGYFIDQAPCPMLVVEPTVEDAKGYSKEEIAPMLRDCPRLAQIVFDDAEEVGPRDSGNTILHKRFPGGVLSMVGANSGAGFRRISRRVVIFDEVDGYPVSAGSDGDPIKLGTKRTEYYHDRKILAGSTPLIAGRSRIEEMFHQGDERRFFVPCPHCGHFDHLVFTEREGGGHWLYFDPDAPAGAHFVCSKNGCVIEHKHKRDMVAAGEWRASKPFAGHASFHIWAAYSYSPNATWAQLAAEFVEAKRGGREQLKTFINTVLGETWKESGEAPEWERLYQRREEYPIGTVPSGVKFLTCGVDVQKDRFVFSVRGWSGREKESWVIEVGVIPADTSNTEHWSRLDEQLLDRNFESPRGPMKILMLAIDSGFNTQMVYDWGRRHERNRVVAVKGVTTARTFISSPTPVDVKLNGKRIPRGYKVWPIGVDIAKGELYGWLRLVPPVETGAPFPYGYVHFPQLGPDYFKQLTGEHLVSSAKKNGFTMHEWQLIPGRENHYLDCEVYNRAAAAIIGVDRMAPAMRAPTPPGPQENLVGPDGKVFEASDNPKIRELEKRFATSAPAVHPKPAKADSRFFAGRGKAWLSKRR